MDTRAILDQLADGRLTVEQALEMLTPESEHNLDFARVDLSRATRQGLPEVVYSPGKTAHQVIEIFKSLRDAGQDCLATRATAELFTEVVAAIPDSVYHEDAKAITLDVAEAREPEGFVLIISAGTSDDPIAAEAALVAQRMGARVERISDIGVSGLHRTLRHVDRMREANALVVVAGMEGALPSVIGGLVDRPVLAVPTSTGYGANLGGVTALLGMLNSCAAGVSVVNIDNGFGAGVSAALINRLASRSSSAS